MLGRRNASVVIVAGCAIALVTYGLRTSFGLFIDPLSDLRGLDREAFALAIGLQNLMWGVGQPFAGAIADRYGAGRVLAVGGVMYAAGTALMAASTSAAALSLTGGVLLGLGLSGASFTIVLAAFARLVPPERRSWAMGLATAAGSLGQFVFAPLGQAFIGAYGPVTALLLLSCFIALVPLLAGALTGRGSQAERDAEPEMSTAAAIRGALSHPSYLLLTGGFFVCGFHVAFITTHLPPYLGDLGFSAGLAAWALALIGLFNVIGAYSAGVLGGIHSKRLLLSGIYVSRGGRVRAVRADPDDAVRRAAVRGGDGPPLALDRAAHLRAGGGDVRHPPRRDAVRLRVPLASGRRLHRRLAGRCGVRGHGHLRSDVVDLDRAQPGRRGGAPPDPGAAGAAVGAERGMSVRLHVLVALLLTIAATAGAAYQASAATHSGSAGDTLRLVCPLH